MFKTRFRFVDTSKLWQTIYPIFFSRPGRGRSLRGSWARWWGLLDWTPPMQILRFMLMFFILILIFFSMLIVIVCVVQRSWCWLCFLFWCWCISWLDTSDAKKVLNWYWIQVEGTRWLEFRKCQFNFFVRKEILQIDQELLSNMGLEPSGTIDFPEFLSIIVRWPISSSSPLQSDQSWCSLISLIQEDQRVWRRRAIARGVQSLW